MKIKIMKNILTVLLFSVSLLGNTQVTYTNSGKAVTSLKSTDITKLKYKIKVQTYFNYGCHISKRCKKH